MERRVVAMGEKTRTAHPEQNATLLELIAEVDHQESRVARVERQIDEAVAQAPERLRAVITALRSLRGIAHETATVLAVHPESHELEASDERARG